MAVRDLVREYEVQIRSLLADRPELQPYLKRCRHCGILFFTHPRNACRDDLRCGFGCRESHRKLSSADRSASYYRDKPEKKRHQNRKRYAVGTVKPAVASSNAPVPVATEGPVAVTSTCIFPLPVVLSICVLVSLIEGRRVGTDEIVMMLRKKWRQHRMVKSQREPYNGRRVNGRGS